MDQKWTGQTKSSAVPSPAPSSTVPEPPHPGPRPRGPLGLTPDWRVPAALGAVAVVILVGAIVLAGGGIFATAGASPSVTASGIAAASPAPSDAPTSSPTPTETPTATPTPTPTATPTPPPLPALLAAIGDSYSQAYSVSPQYRYDDPQFSWVVGTAKDDGVLSLLERFQALGASPVVVDAATSGRKMIDAPRQANLVVAAAKKLGPGKTAYVTFELGTNDLCDDPKTAAASFDAQLRTAVGILRAGLPPGSRILMLPVPDFPHFHAMTQADPATKAALLLPVNSNRCPPYLGAYGPSTTADSNSYLAKYDASLEKVCGEIDAAEGVTGTLYCTYNAALLADSDFTARDLSTYDYFHPSLTGQAKMAEAAWRADAWASIPLP
jgi:lysophospholipase L1-like esterase